jgi:hypothetical protein
VETAKLQEVPDAMGAEFEEKVIPPEKRILPSIACGWFGPRGGNRRMEESCLPATEHESV